MQGTGEILVTDVFRFVLPTEKRKKKKKSQRASEQQVLPTECTQRELSVLFYLFHVSCI